MDHLFNKQNDSSVHRGFDDYREKYQADAQGHELGENARIWRVYNDEAREIDRAMVQNWRETIDILLIFAGLFSAVVTTFVVQASTSSLEPDYAKASALLLAELVNERRQATGSPIITVESSSTANSILSNFAPSYLDSFACGLWFTSLALSLTTSLACVVVKQWLSNYLSPVLAPPRSMAAVRQFRFDGLQKWGVPTIMSALPQLLVVSLFLFLVGLAAYLFPLSRLMAIAIITITAIALVLYGLSIVLAAFIPQCPYRTILSYALRSHVWAVARLAGLSKHPYARSNRLDLDINLLEIKLARWENHAQFGVRCLYWLHTIAHNETIVALITDSLSALVSAPEIKFKSTLGSSWVDAFQRVQLEKIPSSGYSWLDQLRLEVYYRVAPNARRVSTGPEVLERQQSARRESMDNVDVPIELETSGSQRAMRASDSRLFRALHFVWIYSKADVSELQHLTEQCEGAWRDYVKRNEFADTSADPRSPSLPKSPLFLDSAAHPWPQGPRTNGYGDAVA